MILHTYVPGPPLDACIASFIYYADYAPSHAIDRFLPDGNTEIIIDLSETPKPIYHNETLKEIQICTACWASGVRTQPITIPSGADSTMFIIAFKKGMAYPFFPAPMSELTDHVVQADLLWKNFFMDLRERLFEQRSAASCFTLASTLLERKFHKAIQINPCIAYAVDRIVAHPHSLTMQALSNEIGYSQKHFIHMFKSAVGVTPKTYLTISRFQKVIREIERRREVDWSQLALECGYYDQSHFIHEFTRFSGFTPEAYVQKKNGQLNYVPVG